MLRQRGLSLVFLVISLFLVDCQESVIEPPVNGNLLPNGSFEVDHSPTLEGWSFGNPELATLANDAPPNGGNWSLKLRADWVPTLGFAYTSVSNIESADIVKLSAFVRAIGPDGGGFIQLSIGPSVWSAEGNFMASSDTLWSQLSIVDTVTLDPSDSLWVVLSSFPTEVVAREGLFDLVKLERLSP